MGLDYKKAGEDKSLMVNDKRLMINKCAIEITPVGRDRWFARPEWYVLM